MTKLAISHSKRGLNEVKEELEDLIIKQKNYNQEDLDSIQELISSEDA
jgi:predicted HTH domain antitoxin